MTVNPGRSESVTSLERERAAALRRNNESSPKPGYPEGWFQIAYSDEMAPGQVRSIRYFGRDLVMFRTTSGVVQVLDAYCAHLGANLGVGGSVDGEYLRCPFHAWGYGVDGVCKSIPYSERVPKAAAVRSWPTVERAGLVLMWHSAVDSQPLWEAPDMPEYGDPAWAGYKRVRFVVHTSAQEIIENIIDVPHAQFVHGNASIPTGNFNYDKHVLSAKIDIDLPTIGAATNNTVNVHGLGLSITRSVGVGSKSFWSTNTPIDRDTLEIRFSMLTAVSTPTDPTGEKSLHSAAATTAEFEKDIPIWENKIYRANPLVCPGDGPIGRFRLWIRQFYPQEA